MQHSWRHWLHFIPEAERRRRRERRELLREAGAEAGEMSFGSLTVQ